MATTSDISRGMILKLDNNLYSVVEFGENKTARAAAKIWAKLKGVDNKRSIEKTWNSGENIFPVRVEKKTYQFLYKDDSGYNLMNNETFEQIAMAEEMIDAPQYLIEGAEVFVGYNGFDWNIDEEFQTRQKEALPLTMEYIKLFCEDGVPFNIRYSPKDNNIVLLHQDWQPKLDKLTAVNSLPLNYKELLEKSLLNQILFSSIILN